MDKSILRIITISTTLICIILLIFAPNYKLSKNRVEKHFGDDISDIENDEENEEEINDPYIIFILELYIQTGNIYNSMDFYAKFGTNSSYLLYVNEQLNKFAIGGIKHFNIYSLTYPPLKYNQTLWKLNNNDFFEKLKTFFQEWWNPIPALIVILCHVTFLLTLVYCFLANILKKEKGYKIATIIGSLALLVILMLELIPISWTNKDSSHGLFVVVVFLKSTKFGIGLIISGILQFFLTLIYWFNPTFLRRQNKNSKRL